MPEKDTIQKIEEQNDKPILSTLQIFFISFFWFSSSMMWSCLLVILMPLQVKRAVGGDTKGSSLGMVLAIGAFLSLFAAPVFGALSDRIKLPGGKRKPWVLIGVVGSIAGLFGMGYLLEGKPENFWYWAGCYMIVILFNNVAIAPFTALIPDLVPHSQRGLAAGFFGLMTVLGNFFGGILGFIIDSIGVQNVYWILIGSLVLGLAVTWFGVTEYTEVGDVAPITLVNFFFGLFKPFKSRDFTWVFMTRIMFMMGFTLINSFIQYYFGDVIVDFQFFGNTVADSAEKATSVFVPATLLGSILSTLAAGKFSDMFGRKKVVYVSGILVTIVTLVLIFVQSFTITILMGIVFGAGYGAFIATIWALVSDVLPSAEDYANDMGVFHVSDVLPQIISNLLGGIIIDVFQRIGKQNGNNKLGYTVLFILAFVCYVLACACVSRIRKVQ